MSATLGQDVEQQVRDGLFALLDTHAGIATITGRNDGNVGMPGASAMLDLPCVMVLVRDVRPIGGVGRNFEVALTFACYAGLEDDGGDQLARTLRDAVLDVLDAAGPLDAVGLDAVIRPGTLFPRPTITERTPTEHTARADLWATLWLTLTTL